MKDINYRHIQKDLEKLMKDVKDKDKICFVIPPTEKLFIDKVFIKVL